MSNSKKWVSLKENLMSGRHVLRFSQTSFSTEPGEAENSVFIQTLTLISQQLSNGQPFIFKGGFKHLPLTTLSMTALVSLGSRRSCTQTIAAPVWEPTLAIWLKSWRWCCVHNACSTSLLEASTGWNSFCPQKSWTVTWIRKCRQRLQQVASSKGVKFPIWGETLL